MMLTKKDVLLYCTPLQCRPFEDFKSALCTTPLLIYLDPSLLYTVALDATGGVLMEDQEEGLRPVEFMRRTFKTTE